VLERRTHRGIDRREQLGVVQAILRLALELRLCQEHAEHAGETLANVFGGERHALRRQVVCLDEVPHRLAHARAQAVLVRSAGSGRDAIGVAPEVLVGRLGPLQHHIHAHPVEPLQREWRVVHRFGATLPHDLLEILNEPLLVLEDLLLARRLVLERDLHTLVDVADHFEPLADEGGIELHLGKNRRVGMEVDGRAAAA
jgi:hypothetical protein